MYGLVEMLIRYDDFASVTPSRRRTHRWKNGEERRLAQQLADEGGAHALGPLNQPVEAVGVEAQGKAVAIQFEKATAAAGVRQGAPQPPDRRGRGGRPGPAPTGRGGCWSAGRSHQRRRRARPSR